MSIIASYIKKIKPSATLALAAKAKDLKAQGVDVINLSVGEPDFDSFDNIKEAAIDAIRAGKTKYTPVGGIPELKEAIKDIYKGRIEISPSNIAVSAGAKQAIYNALVATIEEGDEVIIPTPYWVSYPDMVKIAGGDPIIVDTTDESNFKITAGQLDKAITSKTKWLILNSPNNPTGMKYNRKELEDIDAVLAKHPKVHIMSDDIYEELSYEDERLSFVDIAKESKNRLLIINGVSKSYSMTGWRIGYAIGPADIIKAMLVIQSQSTSNPSSIGQYAALEALTGPQDQLKSSILGFKSKRDLAHTLLNKIEGISCKKSNGAFYLFPDCKSYFGSKSSNGSEIKDDHDLCSYLIDEAKVVVVPGSAFGYPGHFRLSYAVSKEQIEESLSRIESALKKVEYTLNKTS
jgi:aspartate aminotransferase